MILLQQIDEIQSQIAQIAVEPEPEQRAYVAGEPDEDFDAVERQQDAELAQQLQQPDPGVGAARSPVSATLELDGAKVVLPTPQLPQQYFSSIDSLADHTDSDALETDESDTEAENTPGLRGQGGSAWGRPAARSPSGAGLDLRGLEQEPEPRPAPEPAPLMRPPWWRKLLLPGGVSVVAVLAAIFLAVARRRR